MTEQLDDFLTQVRSLPELIRSQTWPIEDRVRHLFGTPDSCGLRQIIVTGSGDSHVAAVAAAPALRAWTGLPVQPMVSMEAARYLDLGRPPRHPRGTLVVILSNSGEGARPVEAAFRARALGAITVAITAQPGSRLGHAAEHVLDVSIPASAMAPGTRSYVASLLGLYLLGLRIAEVRMELTMDQANGLRKTLADQGDLLEAALPTCEEHCTALGRDWSHYGNADLLGSGSALGSASYAAAKLIEAAGVHACAQDAEEFHHLNYFVSCPAELPTVLFAASASAAESRIAELAGTLQQVGRPCLLVTDDATVALGHRCLVMPRTDELLLPLLHVGPAALLAAAWAEAMGAVHYRGHAGPWQGARNARLVRDSMILTRAETAKG